MVGRVSTYGVQQSLVRDTTNTQSTLFDLQKQLSSGLKSDTFAGISKDVEQFADLESRMSRGQGYIDGNTTLSGRLDTTDQTLSSIMDTANDLKNLISLRRNAAVGDSVAFQTQLEGKWKELVSEMNATQEGRYVFSGTATTTPPVNADQFPTLAQDGVPDAGYYQGSNDDVSMRIDDNVTITYNIRGNDPAFQKIFAGIAMAGKFGTTAGDSPQMQQAYDLVTQGVDGLNSLSAQVNANKVTVQNTADRQQQLLLYWKGLKENISNADIVSLSTEVAVNQGLLQASFQAFARISSLKLSDYLR